jgi:hypothetical protein
MAYERYRCWILNNCPSLGTGPLVDLLAGSASGGTAVLCTYPLDLARTKLAFQVFTLRVIMSSCWQLLYYHAFVILDYFLSLYNITLCFGARI